MTRANSTLSDEHYRFIRHWLEVFNQRIAERDDELKILRQRITDLEAFCTRAHTSRTQHMNEVLALRPEYV